jgi:hypothetical protein
MKRSYEFRWWEILLYGAEIWLFIVAVIHFGGWKPFPEINWAAAHLH